MANEMIPPTFPHTDEVAARLTGVSRVFTESSVPVHALRDVDLAVARGRMTAVMGRSGSGKSTLLQIMAGLDEPTTGTVEIGGEQITGLDDTRLTRLRRRRMGFVFQAFNLLPSLDVAENVRLPFLLAGTRISTGIDARIQDLLDSLGLADRLHHRPAELSGGQQQRVAIARALVTEPDVLFADEPTGSLDSDSSRDVLTLVRRIVDERGQTVVLVTHDASAANAADRIVRMSDGRIIGEEPGRGVVAADTQTVLAGAAAVTR